MPRRSCQSMICFAFRKASARETPTRSRIQPYTGYSARTIPAASSAHPPRIRLLRGPGGDAAGRVMAPHFSGPRGGRARVGDRLRRGSDGSRMTTTRARRTGWPLRLWVGLAIAVGVVFAPGLSRGEGLTLSAAALTYVLGATLFDAIAARHPAFPARVLTPLLGLAAIELIIVAIPRALGAGLVLFLLVVTFSTYVGGLRLGLFLSAAAVPGAVVANAIAPEANRVDGPTLFAFALLVPLLAVLTGRLTAERRRTAVALVRLHDALGAAEEQPDLVTTLHSIAGSVGHAVRARIAGVVVRDR